jgi:hypothetical protein
MSVNVGRKPGHRRRGVLHYLEITKDAKVLSAQSRSPQRMGVERVPRLIGGFDRLGHLRKLCQLAPLT